jgi:hypothetical protein
MHLLLFLAGLIFLFAGVVALGLGVVDYRDTGTSILIAPGTVAAVGGFALLGLGSIGRRLVRLAEMLETQPLPRSIAVPADDPALREAALGADAVKPAPATSAVDSDAAREPAAKVAPPVVVEPVAAARPAEAPPVVSPVATPLAAAGPASPAPPVVAVPSPALDVPPPPASEASEEEAPRVLKSGVIEGMPYTLYSNGTVDAELPRHGTMRFASIAEWRAYIRADQ